MKKWILIFGMYCVTAQAAPVGMVIRTNVSDMQLERIDLHQAVTLHQDQWITVKYFDTCNEETHINSRDTDVIVFFDSVLEGKCDKTNSFFPEHK